jgi:hypothetical protein
MAEGRTPGPVDDTIDRAVRQMMDVDARPGFERRVMRRLARPRRRVFAWPQFAVAGAALATILIVALVLRDAPGRQVGEDPTGPMTATHTPPAVPPSTRGPVTPPNVPPFTAPAPSAERVGRMRPVEAARRDATAANTEDEPPPESQIATIAALDPPNALAVATIEQRPVTIPDITMVRLEIRELNVEPLPALDDGGKE